MAVHVINDRHAELADLARRDPDDVRFLPLVGAEGWPERTPPAQL
jgi:hypothetical protein